MNSNKPRRKRRKAPLAALVVALLILLAFLLGDCFGLGKGDGDGDGEVPPQALMPPVDASDAGAPPTADAQPQVPRCELFLAKEGLQLNGRPSTIEDAARACKDSERAILRVTGDAITGTYKQLVQTFKDADIPIAEEKW